MRIVRLRSLDLQLHVTDWLAQGHAMLLACQALLSKHGRDRSKCGVMPLLLVAFLSNLPAVVFLGATEHD
jgi:hypothetical protein